MFREYERKVRNHGAKRKYDFMTVDREELCYHSRPEKANFRSSSFPLRKYILVLFEIVSIKICDSDEVRPLVHIRFAVCPFFAAVKVLQRALNLLVKICFDMVGKFGKRGQQARAQVAFQILTRFACSKCGQIKHVEQVARVVGGFRRGRLSAARFCKQACHVVRTVVINFIYCRIFHTGNTVPFLSGEPPSRAPARSLPDFFTTGVRVPPTRGRAAIKGKGEGAFVPSVRSGVSSLCGRSGGCLRGGLFCPCRSYFRRSFPFAHFRRFRPARALYKSR